MKKLLSLLSISTLTAGLPTPLLANTTRERTKRTTNPTECLGSCELKFPEILNSNFTNYDASDWRGLLNLTSIKNELPLDLSHNGHPVNCYEPIDGFKDIRIFYERNGKSDGNKYTIDKIVNVKMTFSKNVDFGFIKYYITSFSAEMPPFPSLEWVKQQSQFNLVDSTKTMIWTRPDLITVDGELNIDIANPNIDKIVFDNVEQPQTNKHWNINVKPELAPRDHNLQVMFTLDGKQYTSEIMVSMLAKIDPTPTPTPIQKQLSELIKKTDLGNILDNNDDTIFLAVNKANSNIIDDFTQITIDKKDNHSVTLTAKPDSKSYSGSVVVKYNVIPTTIVDLKIDLHPTAPTTQVVKDYVGQIDTSTITNPAHTFYYASSESVIKLIKPTASSVITGVVYGCDEQWNKTSQPSTIDPIKGIKLDGSQLGAVKGKYLIELKNELGQTNIIYLQINGEKTIKEYWNTDNGKHFEQWAEDNGYKNTRSSSASQLNNLFALSSTWKQSLKHLNLKLDNFVVDNIKNVTQDEINNYKTKLLASVKSQVEKYVPDVVENTDYVINTNNLVAGDWTTSKDVTVQAVNSSTKLLNFTTATIPVQQKYHPETLVPTSEPTPDNKDEDSKLWIIGVVVGVLGLGGIVYLLFRKFIFNKYILPKIYARRQQKVVEQWKRDDREEAEELARKQKQNHKNDNQKEN